MIATTLSRARVGPPVVEMKKAHFIGSCEFLANRIVIGKQPSVLIKISECSTYVQLPRSSQPCVSQEAQLSPRDRAMRRVS